MHPIRSILIAVVSLIISLIMVDYTTAQSTITLRVDPHDSPLIINGTLDGQTTSFSGSVRLTAIGDDVTDLHFLASELTLVTDTAVKLDRSYVSITPTLTLVENIPTDLRVTIVNVMRPGDYAGELKFLVPEQEEVDPLVIPITLHIAARPQVAPLLENMTIQVVRCQGWLDCGLATTLLSSSVVRDDWQVQLNNETLTPVEITSSTVVIRGEKTGNVISATEISLDTPHILPAAQVDSIKLQINRNLLSPDKYVGTFRFKLANADTPVIVNANLNVREGPFWPMVVIFVGIAVGRLMRDHESPSAQLQRALLPDYYELLSRVGNLTNTAARENSLQKLANIKTQIDAAKETEDIIRISLKTLTAQVGFLLTLEDLERQLRMGRAEALRAELLPKIQSARDVFLAGNIDQAEQISLQVEKRIRDIQVDSTMGINAEADHYVGLSAALITSRHNVREAMSKSGILKSDNSAGRRSKQLLALLSGIRINSEIRFWIVRPVLSILLLVILALLGLQTLYVNAGITFGSAGLYDYLGLVLWGLTAEVATRTLSNLGGLGSQTTP